MALYSLNHSSVGKSTHRAGTSSAHIKYIARRSAEPFVMAEHMPEQSKAARAWMNRQEQTSRKNARMIDKIMVALPIELSTDQRKVLIRQFIYSLTKGECPWFAAIHQCGADINNPHAHIVIRDKSVITGRRVALLSEKGSTLKIRKLWAEETNKALKAAGYDVTVDHRSYKDRGIDKLPGRHKGWKHHAKQRQLRNRDKGKLKTVFRKTKPKPKPLYLFEHWMPVANDNYDYQSYQRRMYSPLVPEP